MQNLYRPEAVEAQRLAAVGRIVLVRPLSLAVLTALACAVLAASLAWLSWGEYTRKARIEGQLLPVGGLIRLAAPTAAILAERRVAEGQRVQAGDVLFVLSLDRATAGGESQALVQRSLEARERSLQQALAQEQALASAQSQAAAQRLADMVAEAEQLAAEGALHQQRLALARQALAQLESLGGAQFVSPAQVQARRQELLAQEAQAQAHERAQRRHEREMAALRAEQAERPLRLRARAGEIERERADVARDAAEAESLRRIEVRAPMAGTVSGLAAEQGQPVQAAQALASLVPEDAPLQAVLLAPSRAIGFLRPDQAVALRYHAFPYQKFGHQAGRVVEVSRTPLPADGAGAGTAPMYRVTVALEQQQVQAYGRPLPLAAGMQLEADVMLERRRLVEWLFEPVLSVAGRV